MSAVTQLSGFDPYSTSGETPGAEEQEHLSGNSANGAAVIDRQPTLSHVSPEEAETLPYEQLKARMRQEAQLVEEGVLSPPNGDSADEASQASSGGRNTGATSGDAATGNGAQGSAGTTQQGGTPSREQQLEQALMAMQQQRQQEAEEGERQRIAAQHRNVENAISQMPAHEQEAARNYYQNQLTQSQLNAYNQHVSTREQQVAAQEFKQAKDFFVSSSDNLAAYVAERHGIAPDKLVLFAKSKEARELLDAATNPQALNVAAASIGQTLDWLASQEAQEQAAAKTGRRQTQASRVQRDVAPGAGNVAAGGSVDEITRINNMSRTEFFKYKADMLRDAAAAS